MGAVLSTIHKMVNYTLQYIKMRVFVQEYSNRHRKLIVCTLKKLIACLQVNTNKNITFFF